MRLRRADDWVKLQSYTLLLAQKTWHLARGETIQDLDSILIIDSR